ncbi:MAG TPA: glycosyltransferase family 39 protein [Pseudolabrys sp.]|nr:glycosyltransferase family 39 protein [Pseudolabrys sp.]
MCSANRLVRLYAPCGAVPSHNNLQGFYRAPRTLRVAPIAFKKERNTKGSHELANISEQISQSLKSPRGVVLWTIAVGTCVRLLCAAYAIDLTYGEAYYVASARHFALSYFDHPPLTFWLVGATMKLTGSDALIILRTPFILLFAATTWLMYRLGSSLFGGWEGALSALLLNITPLYAISIGAWVEPDGPLMFCSLAATLCIVSLAFKRKPSAEVLLWVQAGLWLGLAMLCKYYAVLLPAGISLFALTSREHREWFRKPGPYLACAIAVVMFSPVLIWNFEHHWISFNFQGERADITGIDIKALITNILGQAVFIGPWIWIPMLLACRRPLQAGTTNLSSWFLLCLGLVPILFFTTIPLLTRTHGHYYWQALGYLFLFPLLARHVIERLQVRHASTVTWLSLSAVAPFLIIAVIGVEAATGWAYTSLKNFHLKRDVTLEGLEWKELRAAIAQRQLLNRSRLFVATAHRLEVGKVDLEIGKFLPVVCMCEDPRDIAFGWNLSSFSGWDALIIGTEFYIPDVQHTYGDYFQDIERLNDVLIHRGGQVVVTLRVYYAKQYSGSYPLPVPTARSLK